MHSEFLTSRSSNYGGKFSEFISIGMALHRHVADHIKDSHDNIKVLLHVVFLLCDIVLRSVFMSCIVNLNF